MVPTRNNFHMYFVFCISKCILGGSWCWLGEAWSADGSSWDPTSWRHFHPSFLLPPRLCPSMEACWNLGSVLSFDPFISSPVLNFCQKPKTLKSWRHFHPSILPPSRHALSFYGSLLKLGIGSVLTLSFDPFISSLVKNCYQKPKSLSRWRHFSSIQPFSLSPSILYPPCTVFSNQSEWLIPRLNYTRLFVKSNAILCSTKITSPPFFFVPYPVLMYDHEDWKLASARDQFHLRSCHYWLLVKLVASLS